MGLCMNVQSLMDGVSFFQMEIEVFNADTGGVVLLLNVTSSFFFFFKGFILTQNGSTVYC